jgi:hypothetical protein
MDGGPEEPVPDENTPKREECHMQTYPPALLEEWMRLYYFAVDADIGSSGVADYSMAEVRALAGIGVEEMDAIVFHDSQTLGGEGVRRAVARRWAGGDAERVMVTHGSTEAIFLVMNALLSGDEVVVLDPVYPGLGDVVRGLGCRLRAWKLRPEDGWRPDLDELRSQVTERTGSEELITWHVEDAFHPYRGDYLGMMCLRNPDRVPTTFAPISKIELTPDQLAVLSSPHFTIRPDNSHLPKNAGNGSARTPTEAALVERAYRKIEQLAAAPERIPVLFGDPSAPYVRMDPYFMDPPENPAARAAFEDLQRLVGAALEDRALEPGDIVFIDNFQAVHGRKPFKARYDGQDRWLKRINVVRDLRKSRDARVSATSRVLY